jgi:hypothetical protein
MMGLVSVTFLLKRQLNIDQKDQERFILCVAKKQRRLLLLKKGFHSMGSYPFDLCLLNSKGTFNVNETLYIVY